MKGFKARFPLDILQIYCHHIEKNQWMFSEKGDFCISSLQPFRTNHPCKYLNQTSWIKKIRRIPGRVSLAWVDLIISDKCTAMIPMDARMKIHALHFLIKYETLNYNDWLPSFLQYPRAVKFWWESAWKMRIENWNVSLKCTLKSLWNTAL